METLEALKKRRSIRKYKPEQIKDDELGAIIEAGLYAPTAIGRQPWKFVVLQNQEDLDALTLLNVHFRKAPETMKPYYGAPTVIVVFGDKGDEPFYEYDCTLALGNMMNAAFDLGIGSCWIWGEKQMFETEEGRELMEKWGLSANLGGVGAIALGYPDGDFPEAAPRREGTVIIRK
ncbi:MAG: nitroreductase [Eubacteriaceae bacterium]|nr:nitroreductase [Eubacteriaceae bacterium]